MKDYEEFVKNLLPSSACQPLVPKQELGNK